MLLFDSLDLEGNTSHFSNPTQIHSAEYISLCNGFAIIVQTFDSSDWYKLLTAYVYRLRRMTVALHKDIRSIGNLWSLVTDLLYYCSITFFPRLKIITVGPFKSQTFFCWCFWQKGQIFKNFSEEYSSYKVINIYIRCTVQQFIRRSFWTLFIGIKYFTVLWPKAQIL